MIVFMKYLAAMSDKLDLSLCIMQSKIIVWLIIYIAPLMSGGGGIAAFSSVVFGSGH